MFKKAFRFVFILCGMLFGYGVADYFITVKAPESGYVFQTFETILFQAVIIFIFAIIFYKLFNALYRSGEKISQNVEERVTTLPLTELVPALLGLLLGLLAASLISRIINEIAILRAFYLSTIISLLLYFLFGYLGYEIGLKIGAKGIFPEIGTQRGNRSNSKGKGKGYCSLPKIFDTSVIIDGRIHDLLKTGFLEGDIIIPEVVLVELRHLADSSDSLKRARGRRGLDILNSIQADYGIEIYDTTGDKSLEEIPEVDVKLIKLAQMMGGVIVTNDYNLNKVAAITGVGVLNINELANTLKPVVLPGEEMQVFVVKEGKERTQGVGYLDDGTMIVVEDGSRFIGKNISATVTSVLQTSAGRMIFTRAKQ